MSDLAFLGKYNVHIVIMFIFPFHSLELFILCDIITLLNLIVVLANKAFEVYLLFFFPFFIIMFLPYL